MAEQMGTTPGLFNLYSDVRNNFNNCVETGIYSFEGAGSEGGPEDRAYGILIVLKRFVPTVSSLQLFFSKYEPYKVYFRFNNGSSWNQV